MLLAVAGLLLGGWGFAAWGRQHASATAFLLTGLALALLVSASLTATVLESVGALDAGPGFRAFVRTGLALTAVLTIAHFTALALRRRDFDAALRRAHGAVEAVEAHRGRTGALPPDLRALSLPEGAAPLSFTPSADGSYRLCFVTAGRQESCYSSATRQWALRP
jgi:hypothetical protein